MQQSIPYLVTLRVLATFLVILIHASTGYLHTFSANSLDWSYANILNSMSRFSVPLFLLISGALLLDKKEDIFVFYQKRVTRILWPFLFWITVYLVYYFYRYTNVEVLPADRVLEISIEKILHGPSAHLWFLYMIIGVYLAIPFIRILVRHASEKEMYMLLSLWAASLLIMNKSYAAYMPKLDLSFFYGYAGYTVLGYMLAKKAFRVTNGTLAILIIVVILFNTYGTRLYSQSVHGFSPAFYGYLALNNALLASLVFLLCKNLLIKPPPAWLQALDRHSFGIYLVHIIVLNYVHPLVDLPTLYKIPVAALLTMLASFAIIFLLRKIPYGHYISG
ncbi:acyltransferase [Sphingobacterium griseoflavum]|uniref:Acyltransferase 3 domain-containing protein n=1 Tax=Sphingobacterium griseoflavum TaxID=1474952 RepID=A0ABQ3HZE9_9SPHI|nr:acyltransferase family protein [Sphingobacterium griseoflavum]GHE40982.1 hypothetical protein GCM10017764_25330 [Sphingobacterium griseoflavum]